MLQQYHVCLDEVRRSTQYKFQVTFSWLVICSDHPPAKGVSASTRVGVMFLCYSFMYILHCLLLFNYTPQNVRTTEGYSKHHQESSIHVRKIPFWLSLYSVDSVSLVHGSQIARRENRFSSGIVTVLFNFSVSKERNTLFLDLNNTSTYISPNITQLRFFEF